MSPSAGLSAFLIFRFEMGPVDELCELETVPNNVPFGLKK